MIRRLKTGLVALLSAGTLLLVSSCGIAATGSTEKISDPVVGSNVRYLGSIAATGGYIVEMACVGKDKVFLGKVHYGNSVAVVQNHEECK